MQRLLVLGCVLSVFLLHGEKIEAGKRDRRQSHRQIYKRSVPMCGATRCYKESPVPLGASISTLANVNSHAGRIAACLSVVGQPHRDRVMLQITVTNTGATAVVWDSKFSVFMDWKVEADGMSIHSETVKDLEGLPDSVTPTRFVTLCPGQCLSMEVMLTSLRLFWSGHGSFISPEGHYGHIPTAGESIFAFRIPEAAKTVKVRLVYDTDSSDTIGGDVFKFYFGYAQSSVQLPNERVVSNEITIHFD